MPADRLKEVTHTLAYWTAVPTFLLGWGFRATGREHLPRTGPALLVANHESYIDPVLVGTAATRWLTYLARSNLWTSRPLGRLISHFGAAPIDRGFGRDGLQAVLSLLDRGEAVLMFPEGERTHTGEVQELKPGVHLLLRRVTCPVVPVGIAGAYAAWPRARRWPLPDPLGLPSGGRSIAVAFGRPCDPARFAGRDRGAALVALWEEIVSAKTVAERVRRKAPPGPRSSASG